MAHDPAEYERLLPDFKSPNATIFIRSLPDKRYVWVNHEFQRDHGGYGAVLGKTQIQVFGAEASKPWELSDGLTVASRYPTTTVESYGERRYGLTKFIATDETGEDFLVGIGMEIKADSRRPFEKKLQELTERVLAQLRAVTMPAHDADSDQ